MDVLKLLNDERSDEIWKNDPQDSRIALLEATIAEITRLRAALAIYALDSNWQRNGVLDANCGKFRGSQIAQDALKEV